MANLVAKRYRERFEQEGLAAANAELRERWARYQMMPWRLGMSDNDLTELASRLAAKCSEQRARTRDVSRALRAAADVADGAGVKPPDPNDTISVDGALRRLCDARWWRRKLRQAHGRAAEELAIDLGQVHKYASPYASGQAVARRRYQKQRHRALLSSMVAINEEGDELPLDELVERSLANPRVRRSELMVRIFGTEQYAREHGHAPEFYTLTCPSRMHARLATSHLHFLLFLPAEQVNAVRSVLREYALREDGDEPGASKHRFKAVPIDWTRGTATGYVAKYVSKNIDGHGLDVDAETGEPVKRTVERVDAWASTWRCRQFQFFGSPPVTVWRELRRVINPEDGALGELAVAADAGDWKGFLTLMGGPGATRAKHAERPLTCWSDEPGRYGEPKGNRIVGVATGDAEVTTRHHTWRLDYKRDNASEPTRTPNPPWAEEHSVPLTATRNNNVKRRVAATCGASLF